MKQPVSERCSLALGKKNGYGELWERWVAVWFGGESLGQLLEQQGEELHRVMWIKTSFDTSSWEGRITGLMGVVSPPEKENVTHQKPANCRGKSIYDGL